MDPKINKKKKAKTQQVTDEARQQQMSELTSELEVFVKKVVTIAARFGLCFHFEWTDYDLPEVAYNVSLQRFSSEWNIWYIRDPAEKPTRQNYVDLTHDTPFYIRASFMRHSEAFVEKLEEMLQFLPQAAKEASEALQRSSKRLSRYLPQESSIQEAESGLKL